MLRRRLRGPGPELELALEFRHPRLGRSGTLASLAKLGLGRLQLSLQLAGLALLSAELLVRLLTKRGELCLELLTCLGRLVRLLLLGAPRLVELALQVEQLLLILALHLVLVIAVLLLRIAKLFLQLLDLCVSLAGDGLVLAVGLLRRLFDPPAPGAQLL